MSLSEIFPIYPIGLRTGKGWKLRISSHKCYVDLPYVFPEFIGKIAFKYRKIGIDKKTFEKEKKKWKKENEELIYFNGKQIATVQLISSHSLMTNDKRPFIKLVVNWNVFFRHLDNLAKNIIQNGIRKDGEKCMQDLYSWIYKNYFALSRYSKYGIILTKFTGNIRTLQYFKRIVRISREKERIEKQLQYLERLIRSIERLYSNELPHSKFYTLHMRMDVEGARKCLENMNIVATYFYLRNLLEHFIKFSVYLRVANSFEKEFSNIILGLLYLYEKEIGKAKEFLRRKIKVKKVKIRIETYSHEKFLEKWLGKIEDIKSFLKESFSKKDNLIIKMAGKGLPVLKVNKNLIREFCQKRGLSPLLLQCWKACSYVIHNQAPLPFYSLLEVKGLRVFLEIFTKEISEISNIIYHINTETLNAKTFSFDAEIKFPSPRFLKEVEDVIYSTREEFEIIKKRVKKALLELKSCRHVWFKPYTLISIFKLLDVNSSHIKKRKFFAEDINEFLHYVHGIGFKVDVEREFNYTFEIIYNKIFPIFSEIIPKLNTLSDSEKKGTILYLLIVYFSPMLKEILTERNQF